MVSRRQMKVSETLAHITGEFLARESNRTSLITITRSDISPDMKNIMFFVSVLPQNEEVKALAFLKRIRTDVRDYIKQKASMKFLPTVDFCIDDGEKNRQLIDDLTRKQK